MNRLKLPIHEIKIEDRQRQDLGDIAELARSLSQFGLIQPVVISQDKRLLAGGRRLAAALHLGWRDIDVVYRETLSLDEAFEVELEENVRRKDMSWQERCLNVATIYDLKRQKAALDGVQWGMQETAALLGTSKTNVHYCITLAKELKRSKESPIWREPTMADAWRLVLRKEQEADEARLKELQVSQAQTLDVTSELPGLAAYTNLDDLPDNTVSQGDIEREHARERYLANPANDPDRFDEYWAEKQKRDGDRRNTIPISRWLVHGDCIPFMLEHESTFDHVITDIPYAIEMDNLAQSNTGMVDMDTVEEEHDVDANKDLMARFFPAAFKTLKDHGFCVTWCDQMLWQYMYDLATAAGFKVQRWPITWNKLNRCMNQAAQYNFTKSTEIAMVCRKGNAVLMHTASTSVVTASNEDMVKVIGHKFAKPRECWQFIAHHVSFQGQLILEPFAGRGSGVLSLLEMSRNVIAVELQTEHYNALLENVRKHYLAINPNARFI